MNDLCPICQMAIDPDRDGDAVVHAICVDIVTGEQLPESMREDRDA